MSGDHGTSIARCRLRRMGIVTLCAASAAGTLGGITTAGARAAKDPLIRVPCSVPALVQAFDTANSVPASAFTIELATRCTYALTEAASSGDGLPTVVNRNLTVNGRDATITRDARAKFRILQVAGGSRPGNLTLNDVTISGGAASGDSRNCPQPPPPLAPALQSCGGGILVGNFEVGGGALAVNRSRITGNTADIGGGILSFGATLAVNSSTIGDNTAGIAGAGIGNASVPNGTPATATVTRSVIGSNAITNDRHGSLFGGGIFNGNEGATMALSDSRVTDNSVTNDGTGDVCAALGCVASGAGIFNSGALTLTRTPVTGNTATAPTDGGLALGGGIFNGAVLRLTGSPVRRNTATSLNFSVGGGIDNSRPGTVGLSNSDVTENVASTTAGTAAGGGIFTDNDVPNAVTLSNSRVVRNRPDQCFSTGSPVVGC